MDVLVAIVPVVIARWKRGFESLAPVISTRGRGLTYWLKRSLPLVEMTGKVH